MAGHEKHGSDMGAAFTGLIGGAILLGAILYSIITWTNGRFAEHHKDKAVATVQAPVVG